MIHFRALTNVNTTQAWFGRNRYYASRTQTECTGLRAGSGMARRREFWTKILQTARVEPKTTRHYDSYIDPQVDDHFFSVPPSSLLFLLQTCYIEVKIVLQLVPNVLQIALKDIKQNVCMYGCSHSVIRRLHERFRTTGSAEERSPSGLPR